MRTQEFDASFMLAAGQGTAIAMVPDSQGNEVQQIVLAWWPSVLAGQLDVKPGAAYAARYASAAAQPYWVAAPRAGPVDEAGWTAAALVEVSLVVVVDAELGAVVETGTGGPQRFAATLTDDASGAVGSVVTAARAGDASSAGGSGLATALGMAKGASATSPHHSRRTEDAGHGRQKRPDPTSSVPPHALRHDLTVDEGLRHLHHAMHPVPPSPGPQSWGRVLAIEGGPLQEVGER